MHIDVNSDVLIYVNFEVELSSVIACPAHSPLTGNVRVLRTSDTTREFHFKITINLDFRIYVNILVRTTLDIAIKP
jgi:hypothetical protein